MCNLEYTRRREKKTNEMIGLNTNTNTLFSREKREELREKEILPKKQSNAATRFLRNEIEYIYFFFFCLFIYCHIIMHAYIFFQIISVLLLDMYTLKKERKRI